MLQLTKTIDNLYNNIPVVAHFAYILSKNELTNGYTRSKFICKWYSIINVMKRIHSVWKEDKWYVAKALEIEVASQGKTEKAALDNLKEALALYFEDEANVELAPVNKPKLQDLSIQFNA